MSVIERRADRMMGIEVTVNSGEIGDLVYFSDDDTVSVAGADCANKAGILAWKDSKTGEGMVETFFHHEVYVEFDGAVAAGDWVKVGAPNANGEQTFKKWVSGTDAETLRVGMCKLGGADEAKGEILI